MTDQKNLINIQNKAEFEKILRESDKPVLVDFWSPSCPPCRTLNPIIADIAESKDWKDKITVLKVNTLNIADIHPPFKVRGIPTMILFMEGKEVARQTGAAPKVTIENWLTESLKLGELSVNASKNKAIEPPSANALNGVADAMTNMQPQGASLA